MKNINERNNFVFEFRPVTELFEEQVKLHPEKCAVATCPVQEDLHVKLYPLLLEVLRFGLEFQ